MKLIKVYLFLVSYLLAAFVAANQANVTQPNTKQSNTEQPNTKQPNTKQTNATQTKINSQAIISNSNSNSTSTSVNNSKRRSLAFNQQQFEQIKQQYQGKQWLMLLWSVDCPPCFKELALVSELYHQRGPLNIVLINTDADEAASTERQHIINKFNLASLANYHFVDGSATKSRYLIDPSWYGELPRSYFVEQNGKFNGQSGLIKRALLQHWLVQ